MARTFATATFLALGFLAACDNSGTSGDNPDGGDGTGGGDMAPAFPAWDPANPAICGQAPYTWQPANKVGTVLQSSKNFLPVPKLVIQGIETAAYFGSQLSVHHPVNYDVQTAVIRYQTQDRGQLVDATAMVTWPRGAGANFPTVLFLHPTLGYTDECAPSKSPSSLTAPMTIFSMITAAAGYIAVFPDYLNQRSQGTPSTHVTPYLLMEPTALVSLDALRAAQAYVQANESGQAKPTRDVYVWGHSQGAQAVEYVLAMQPLYAPEFNFKAAAAVSPPSDLRATAKANFASTAPTYGLGEAVAYAWWDYYGGTPLTSALRPPWDGMALTQMKNYCNTNYMDPIDMVSDPKQVFDEPFLDALTNGAGLAPWSCWLHYNSPATMGPKMNTSIPMLYVTGAEDTTVPPAANDPVTAKWCSEGMKIQYLQCTGATHVQSIAVSVDDVLTFFDDRVAGRPLPSDTCQPKPATRCASTP